MQPERPTRARGQDHFGDVGSVVDRAGRHRALQQELIEAVVDVGKRVLGAHAAEDGTERALRVTGEVDASSPSLEVVAGKPPLDERRRRLRAQLGKAVEQRLGDDPRAHIAAHRAALQKGLPVEQENLVLGPQATLRSQQRQRAYSPCRPRADDTDSHGVVVPKGFLSRH